MSGSDGSYGKFVLKRDSGKVRLRFFRVKLNLDCLPHLIRVKHFYGRNFSKVLTNHNRAWSMVAYAI